MLRVQANQCKIDSFAISLNTKKRSHVSKYGSIERELLSARAPTSQPASHHTHAHFSILLSRSLARSRSLPFCLYAWDARMDWMRVSWSCRVRAHWVWESVCVRACVYITFESCMNCALSHRYAHTIERERKILSFDVQQRAPSLGISVHFVLLLLYCFFFALLTLL